MAVTAHVFPSFMTALNAKSVNIATDTLKVQLVASSSPAYTWNSTAQGHVTVANFMAGSGAGALTEVSSSGYTSGGVAFTAAASKTNQFSDVTVAVNPSWTGVTFSAAYALFYDSTASQIICYWDFGGTQTVTGATFTLALGTSTGGVTQCLAEWTSN